MQAQIVDITFKLMEIVVLAYWLWYIISEDKGVSGSIKANKKNIVNELLIYMDAAKKSAENEICTLDILRKRQMDYLLVYMQAVQNKEPLPIIPNEWLTSSEYNEYRKVFDETSKICADIKAKYSFLN